MKSMETGRQDGGSDKNHALFSVGETGNISRKFLTIILKIFDKNFERLHTDILSQLRGATTNINQIARKLHTDGEIPNDSMLYFLNKNILKYRKESEKIWLLIRRLISGQIHMEQ